MTRQLDFRASIKHAVSRPFITAAMCGFVLWLVITLVFPRFIALYQQMEMTLPWLSQLVFFGVKAVSHPLTFVALAAGGAAAVIYRRELQQRVLNFLLWLPATRGLVGKCLCASLCETLAYLYRDGVPVHRSLEMLIATTSFDAHRVHLRRALSTLCNTGSLCEAMDRLPYFPPVFHSMLVVGEESGSMEAMLSANRRLMEEEIDALLNSITAMLEPLVVCLMGIGMAILFVGMFVPIYGILAKLGGA